MWTHSVILANIQGCSRHPLFNAQTLAHTHQAHSGLRLRDKSSADALLCDGTGLRCLGQHKDEDYVVSSEEISVAEGKG